MQKCLVDVWLKIKLNLCVCVCVCVVLADDLTVTLFRLPFKRWRVTGNTITLSVCCWQTLSAGFASGKAHDLVSCGADLKNSREYAAFALF